MFGFDILKMGLRQESGSSAYSSVRAVVCGLSLFMEIYFNAFTSQKSNVSALQSLLFLKYQLINMLIAFPLQNGFKSSALYVCECVCVSLR